MGGMLPWGFRYSDIFNSFRHIISLAFGNLRLLEAAVPLRQSIAVRFALSDGQTLTVLHHQPPRA